jgi:hypothetical protein
MRKAAEWQSKSPPFLGNEMLIKTINVAQKVIADDFCSSRRPLPPFIKSSRLELIRHLNDKESFNYVFETFGPCPSRQSSLSFEQCITASGRRETNADSFSSFVTEHKYIILWQ